MVSHMFGTLTFINAHRYPYTWFVFLNENIIRREFALSGRE